MYVTKGERPPSTVLEADLHIEHNPLSLLSNCTLTTDMFFTLLNRGETGT